MDADEFRATSRESWERVAKGWAAGADAMARDTIAVSRWLADAIRPQPGHVVLEVAAGVGDTGLLIAELVAPGGRVILTDGAEAMVEVAKARAEQLGVTGVETRVMEAEWLDLPTASVDSVVCRWAYMLLADPETALREARRVLRPGGRIALAVWAPAEHNRWATVPRELAVARGLSEPDAPEAPGMFALADAGKVRELLETAGFADVETDLVELAFTAPDLDAWWDDLMMRSGMLRAALAKLPPAEHYRFRDGVDAGYAAFVEPGGAVRLPALALVAAADA